MKQIIKMEADYSYDRATSIVLELAKQGFSVSVSRSSNLWTIEAEKELPFAVSNPKLTWTEPPVIPYTYISTTTKGDSL